MKLLSLNLWGGRLYDPLVNFLKIQREDIDIFCFQEVFSTKSKRIFTRTEDEVLNPKYRYEIIPRANIFEDLQKLFPNFNSYFFSAQDSYDYRGPVNFELSYGLAIFSRKEISILDAGNIFVFGKKNNAVGRDNTTLGKNIEYINFEYNRKVITVNNLHGLFTGKGKGDTKTRIDQSKNIRDFLEKQKGEKILAGDFNLNPGTKSLLILEKEMINLIKEFKIKSTRSKLYDRYHLGDKFADYILVSKGIKVKDFKVLGDEVSDHLPLYLDFE